MEQASNKNQHSVTTEYGSPREEVRAAIDELKLLRWTLEDLAKLKKQELARQS